VHRHRRRHRRGDRPGEGQHPPPPPAGGNAGTAANTAGEARASACEAGCPPRNRLPGGQHSDPAKRCADKVNLVIAAEGTEAVGKWLAVRLDSGDCDLTVYPHQADAVRAMMPYEREHCYIRVPRQWITQCEAESFLRFNRMRYDAGMGTMPDPRDVIRPLTRNGHQRQMEQFARALGLPADLYRYS
jgi:hypothetical protein